MLRLKNDKHKLLEVDYEKTNKYAIKFEKLSEGKKISLMNDNMFKTMFVNSNEDVIEIFYIQNDKRDVITDKLIFINISIPNLREKWYNKGINELSELERYILSLIETDIDIARAI